MRTIRQTGQFKHDLKREARGAHRAVLAKDFAGLVERLAHDEPLPNACGPDCHVRPDLVLICRKPDVETLELGRLGSHSELAL